MITMDRDSDLIIMVWNHDSDLYADHHTLCDNHDSDYTLPIIYIIDVNQCDYPTWLPWFTHA